MTSHREFNRDQQTMLIEKFKYDAQVAASAKYHDAESVRSFLKKMGLSDAVINHQFMKNVLDLIHGAAEQLQESDFEPNNN